MVKGVSRQVIVVKSGEKDLFEQAIFVLKEGAEKVGISDEMLLKEAEMALKNQNVQRILSWGPLWACGGALATGFIWLLTALI